MRGAYRTIWGCRLHYCPMHLSVAADRSAARALQGTPVVGSYFVDSCYTRPIPCCRLAGGKRTRDARDARDDGEAQTDADVKAVIVAAFSGGRKTFVTKGKSKAQLYLEDYIKRAALIVQSKVGDATFEQPGTMPEVIRMILEEYPSFAPKAAGFASGAGGLATELSRDVSVCSVIT